MMRVPLDSSTKKTLTCALFVNVSNTKEVRAQLLDGSLKCCIISPKFIVDPLQVVVAANKAALSASDDNLVTRTVYTELLFNLSSSKNISQALTKFGISDTDKDFIVCTIDDDDDKEGLSDLLPNIKGKISDMEALIKLCDMAAIKKNYHISDIENKTYPLIDSIVSRIAASDFS